MLHFHALEELKQKQLKIWNIN